MNAIQFIKQYGLHSARVTVDDAQENTHYCTETGYHSIKLDVAYEPCPYCVSIPELKRLVESVDLVKRYGGIAEVKTLHQDEFWNERVFERLKQAIADYESIENHVSPNCKVGVK